MKATSEMETTVTTLTVCRGEEAKEKLVTLSLSTPAISVAAMKTASISQSEKYITPLKQKNHCADAEGKAKRISKTSTTTFQTPRNLRSRTRPKIPRPARSPVQTSRSKIR